MSSSDETIVYYFRNGRMVLPYFDNFGQLDEFLQLQDPTCVDTFTKLAKTAYRKITRDKVEAAVLKSKAHSAVGHTIKAQFFTAVAEFFAAKANEVYACKLNSARVGPPDARGEESWTC